MLILPLALKPLSVPTLLLVAHDRCLRHEVAPFADNTSDISLGARVVRRSASACALGMEVCLWHKVYSVPQAHMGIFVVVVLKH